MRKSSLVLAACSVLALAGAAIATSAYAQAYVTAAVADAGRPQVDKDRDVHRKPADMVVYGEIKPGAKVGELIPGRG